MHDPVFYDRKFPFKDPSVLLNREITVDEIREMHRQDATDETGLETGEQHDEQDAVG